MSFWLIQCPITKCNFYCFYLNKIKTNDILFKFENYFNFEALYFILDFFMLNKTHNLNSNCQFKSHLKIAFYKLLIYNESLPMISKLLNLY